MVTSSSSAWRPGLDEPPVHSRHFKIAQALGLSLHDFIGAAQRPAREEARRFADLPPAVRRSILRIAQRFAIDSRS